MALSLRRGTVTAIAEQHEGLVRCEVDGELCVAYPGLTGAVALGDEVVVNVQGRELALGSGGFDVLHVNLTRGIDLPPPPDAHVMKLPYAPVQYAVRHAEEAGPVADALGGTPVLAVRVSSGDERQRHRGVSHHTRAVVELCLAEATVAWPAGLEAPEWLASRRELDVDEWREACEGLPLDHMGRRSDEDPWFFASAFAAGKLARTLIG